MLEVIQKLMFGKQVERIKNSTIYANDFDKFLEGLNKGNIVYTPWCKDQIVKIELKKKWKK